MTSHYESAMVPRPRPLSHKKTTLIAVLDVGSHKIACAIARMRPVATSDILPGRTHVAEIIGFGHQRSEGIKSGTVIDTRAAETAIRNTIDHAERAAGVEANGVIMNVSAGRMRGNLVQGALDVADGQVDAHDVQAVCNAAVSGAQHDGRILMHCMPKSYSLDHVHDIPQPEGLFGKRLGVDLHAASVDSAALNNLILCVERCHLNVDAVIATPYASGLAVLADDEARLGATIVDIGAGTTTIATFANGALVHMESLAIGGQHITNDLARGLSTRTSIAERLKTLHGSAVSTSLDEREFLTISPVGAPDQEGPHHVPRSKLVGIIRPRVDEILEMARDKMRNSPHHTASNRTIVLTGGSAQLSGLVDVAKHVFGRSVRIGRPLGVAGLPDAAKGPAFSALAGMMIAPQLVKNEVSITQYSGEGMYGSGGYFQRMGQWLKESF